jgi:hypothetical protein
LLKSPGDGTLNGEGAVYIALSGEKRDGDAVSIDSVMTIYAPNGNDLDKKVATS